MTERQTQRRQDAKPQGIGRRAFVTLGLGSGAAALLAACGWDGGTLVRPGLWSISRVNDWVGETLLYSPTRLARTYPASERSAALPSYFISRTMRSEEHTSELQSQSNLVCRLLLEKKTHDFSRHELLPHRDRLSISHVTTGVHFVVCLHMETEDVMDASSRMDPRTAGLTLRRALAS